jgi:hypothetical protein
MLENPTFKAIWQGVDLTLCLAAGALAVCIIFSINAVAKSMTDTEYKFLKKNIETEFNSAKIRCSSTSTVEFAKCISAAESVREASMKELEARRKILVSIQSDSHTAKTEAPVNMKSINTNSMPIIDGLNSSIKLTRLI